MGREWEEKVKALMRETTEETERNGGGRKEGIKR